MAVGTYNAEHVDQLLRCPVCLDRYNAPKILPCQHTVCRAPCLEGLIDRFTRTVKCPQCRAEHFLPRNGVDSFPTNITIAGFLDLQASENNSARDDVTANGGASGGNPRKCAVCENEADTVKCFHCSKMVCPSCKQSHTGQMRMEVGRLINQIRRGLPKLSNRMSVVEQKGECMKQSLEAIKAQVKGTIERYVNELKQREALLCSELDTFQQGELRSLRLHSENIEVELASISSYCDSMERFLNNDDAEIPEADLVNIRHQCSEYMQQLRQSEEEEIPQTRTARFDFSGEPLQMSIANFGAITVQAPANSTQNPSRNSSRREEVREREQSPPRTRARWSVPTPGGRGLSLARDMVSPSPAMASYPSRPPVPQYRPPTPPYQTDPMLSRRSPRNDMSWIQPSHAAPGEPDRSIYLPSRHEDYMMRMSTDTSDIREVLEEIRRQEEWEMNNSIRDRARDRNRQQNIDLFGHSPTYGRGRGQRGRGYERMGGLMGGGGGGAGGAVPGFSGAASADPLPSINSSRLQDRPATPVIADVDSLLALENEIHSMDTSSNQGAGSQNDTSQSTSRGNRPRAASEGGLQGAPNRGAQPTPESNTNASQNATAASLRPVRNQTRSASNDHAANADERPLMGGGSLGGGGAVGGGSNDGGAASNTASNRGGRNGLNPRGRSRGRGACRPQQLRGPRPPNTGNNNTPSNSTQSNPNASNSGPPQSNGLAPRRLTQAQGNQSNNRGQRTGMRNGNNPPAAAGRSRTFVQEETTAPDANNLPAVSDNGMSFSISFDDPPPPNASSGNRRGNSNNNSNRNGGNSGPRPSDSLTVNRAMNQYKRKGQPVKTLGNGKGSGEGQLKWPRGIAISPVSDSILVADSSNHRVQIFDVNGSFMSSFGSYGQQDGEFDCLTGIAVSGAEEIVICDRYNNRVQVFDRYGQFLRTFGSEGREDGQLSYPWGVTTDAAGLIYVCDKENHRIQVFRSDGTFVRKFGTLGSRPGQFENPHYIAITPENKILVSDSSNHRIQMFTTTGTYIKSFGSQGNGNGQLKCPKGVVVDSQGFVIVADSGNSRIQIFRGNGDYFCHFGVAGTGRGQFRGIEGVSLTKDGKIVVCDSDNHRIQMF